MSFSRCKLAAALLLLALACAPLAAAQEQGDNKSQPAPDTSVTHTSFKNRVFEVKYRDPESLLPVLRLLTSGHRGAGVTADRTFKTLTVRDFPENIASVEEALRRLDTPEAPRPEVELRMHVLLASNADGLANQSPADLKDVVSQLQSTLNYKSYYLLTTVIQRARDRAAYFPAISGEGLAQLKAPGGEALDFNYAYAANSLTFTPAPSGAMTVQLGQFYFRLSSKEGNAQLRSDVGVREGEKVVVGTAGLRDKALILVLTARLLK